MSASALTPRSQKLAKLKECDLIFAIVSGGDPGTLFEVGYAFRSDKPIMAFYQNARPSDLTMLTGSNCHVQNDLGAAIYEAIWRCMAQ
jgi:nucleoside 2-deoxyribosyltransferase